MDGRRRKRLRWWGVVACGLTLVTGALILAQAGGQTSGGTAPNQVSPPVATQPVEPAASQPAATQAVPIASQTAAREQLMSGLIGSKHDFTHDSRLGRDLCLPCHTPHLLAVPLPRLDRRPLGTLPLRPFRSLAIELDGWSLLCLGCHDGVTAPDVYSMAHAVVGTGQLAGSVLGTRGLRSHPVGVKYPEGAACFESRAAVEVDLMLPDGRIQCATCHDAHNTHRHARMLRISNERSRLCLTCHRI